MKDYFLLIIALTDYTVVDRVATIAAGRLEPSHLQLPSLYYYHTQLLFIYGILIFFLLPPYFTSISQLIKQHRLKIRIDNNFLQLRFFLYFKEGKRF
jgi:hypothetical protein